MATASVIHNEPTTTPTFFILSEGKPISGKYGIVSIFVSRSVNKITSAYIDLLDGDPAKETFELSESEEFVPGKEIEIYAGYSGNDYLIFKGIVIKNGIRSKGHEDSFLNVELKDHSVAMTVGKKDRYFDPDQTDSAIIEEILKDYPKMIIELEDTTVNQKEMVQYHCTDWDFILSRVEANSQLVDVNGGSLRTFTPDLNQKPILTITYGRNTYDFSAEIDVRDQYAGVSSYGWDPAQQRGVEFSSTLPANTEPGNISSDKLAEVIGLGSFKIQHSGLYNRQEMTVWSNAKMLRSKLAKIIGHVKIKGYSDIRPGDLIKLLGFGERFNGVFFVSGVSHQIGLDSSWYTRLDFGLSQDWFLSKYDDIPQQPASGLLPSVNGLQIGVVTEIATDQDGEERIRVRIPVVDSEGRGSWARLCTLDAGPNGRGTYFRPEINDEVVVGYLNDDPRNPVILGVLHSSAHPSAVPPSEKNFKKGYRSREKLELVFDDELPSISLRTPKGKKIEFDDKANEIKIEDNFKNKVCLSSSGISFQSEGDIKIIAGKSVFISAKRDVIVKASKNMTVTGTSGSEFSSGGQTIVKGTQVAIN